MKDRQSAHLALQCYSRAIVEASDFQGFPSLFACLHEPFYGTAMARPNVRLNGGTDGAPPSPFVRIANQEGRARHAR
jgi:hypothetical protein